ncbi:small GTPase superfamily, Ras type, partial [Kipferlia bialata]
FSLAVYLLAGCRGVGLTSALCQIVDGDMGRYDTRMLDAIDMDRCTLTLSNGTSVSVTVMPIAPGYPSKVVASMVYDNRGTHAKGALLLYDVCDRVSYENAQYVLSAVSDVTVGHNHQNLILVGNKADRGAEREVSYAEARGYADQMAIGYAEVSVLQGVTETGRDDGGTCSRSDGTIGTSTDIDNEANDASHQYPSIQYVFSRVVHTVYEAHKDAPVETWEPEGEDTTVDIGSTSGDMGAVMEKPRCVAM